MNNQPLPKPSQVKKPGAQQPKVVTPTSGPKPLPSPAPAKQPLPQGSSSANQNKNPKGGGKPPIPSKLPGGQGKPPVKAGKPPADSGKPPVKTESPPAADSAKKEVVFDGSKNGGRVPLAQKPGANKPPATNIKVKFPPTSLSALSSMSSNVIPENGKVVMPETTVLGTPIPQTIRGEKMPKGLNAGASRLKPTSAPVVPAPASPAQAAPQTKAAPVPVAPNRGDASNSAPKGESADIKKPKFATQKNPILKFIPLIIGVILVLAVIVFAAISLFGGSKSTPIVGQPSNNQNTVKPTIIPGEGGERVEVPAEVKEINYWGLWEPNEVIDEIITSFESENPGIKVKYLKQSHKDIRERLQTSLDSGTGPDIFRYHASWVPMFKNNLYPIPTSVITAKEFQENYYPVVSDQLVVGGQYVGIPLMYEGLALYYNEEIFESANETPPTTWAELRLLASKLTVRSADKIERAGLAIGNTSNVEHFADILAVLMLQNGADFNEPNSQETKDALLFYTNFVLKDEVWDEKMPSSTVAFARGDVAMMFAPSWRAHEINEQNPNLRYRTMTLPQLSEERVTWGSYWAEGINAASKNKEEAALFLTYINKDENLKKLFSKASEIRSFGELYPKASMAEELVNDEVMAAFLDDAVYSKGWYLNSFTHDNGINDQLIKYYEDGINAVLSGEKMEDVLLTIDAGTKEVLKQYGVSSK